MDCENLEEKIKLYFDEMAVYKDGDKWRVQVA